MLRLVLCCYSQVIFVASVQLYLVLLLKVVVCASREWLAGCAKGSSFCVFNDGI